MKICADINQQIYALINGENCRAKIDAYIRGLLKNAPKPFGDPKMKEHLKEVNKFIEKRSWHPNEALDTYEKMLRGEKILDSDAEYIAELKLSGLTTVGYHQHLVIRNRVYRRLFNDRWIAERRDAIRSVAQEVA